MIQEKTQPKPLFSENYKADSADLAAGRYGTEEMIKILGAEQTFQKSLEVQGQAAIILSELHPDIVPIECADELAKKATLEFIDADRIRELEEQEGHDVIAINTSLEEVVSTEAGTHINKFKTSADTTQPVKALQLKEALEVIIDSTQNLRDIILEKSMEWIDIPHMDTTHLYDAVPTVAGRPLSHYAEMLQSDLEFLSYVYHNSIIGKWADATGNHHSATALDVDGIKVQEEYCKRLGIGFMDAPAQVPGLEFEADIFYALARLGMTMGNIARYIATGRGDDVNIFVNMGKKKKGSSAMPHKDAKRGNPTAEEQVMSIANYLTGNLTTAMMNCQMPYARDLSASSNARINVEDGFKYMDHGIRRLAKIIYDLGIKEDRCKERVLRSKGWSTSQLVTTYLTDHRKTDKPMARSDAHDLLGKLATEWDNKTPFVDALLQNEEITSRLDENTIMEITDPLKYIGLSKEIVKIVYDKYHKNNILETEK